MQRRNLETLLQGLRRLSIYSPVSGATQVEDMDERRRKELDTPVNEHWPGNRHVIGVDSAAVRVVDNIDITLAHCVGGIILEYGPNRFGDAATVKDRGGGSLRDEAAISGEDCGPSI